MRRLFLCLVISSILTGFTLVCGVSRNAVGAHEVPPSASILDRELKKSNVAPANLTELRRMRAEIDEKIALMGRRNRLYQEN